MSKLTEHLFSGEWKEAKHQVDCVVNVKTLHSCSTYSVASANLCGRIKHLRELSNVLLNKKSFAHKGEVRQNLCMLTLHFSNNLVFHLTVSQPKRS